VVLLVEVTENALPLGLVVEPVRVVQGVTRLVTQPGEDALIIFQVVSELLLVSVEARLDQVERDPDQGMTVDAAPLVRDEAGWLERHTERRKLIIKTPDEGRDGAGLEAETEVIHPGGPEVVFVACACRLTHAENDAWGPQGAQVSGE
jgi:hypothetical protein